MDGMQAIADLGVGFVESIGDGMTTDNDMPNHGGRKSITGDWGRRCAEAG